MLGLGDIVVPGLLLTFAARCDLSLRGAASPLGYWGAAAAGYLSTCPGRVPDMSATCLP